MQRNGIFWYIDDEDELLSYPFGSVECPGGIAKSGDTYNHKRFWNDLKPKGSRCSYNYYPRGRVDWDRLGRQQSTAIRILTKMCCSK